jgi:hypothetical protein
MKWVWLVRAIVVAAVTIAVLEREGIIPTLHGRLAFPVLIILMVFHLLNTMRIARHGRR